jgi:uncharacterized damage-inducible protein DinB
MDVPVARVALLQYLIDTYASETNKVVSVWRRFDDAEMSFRPHERSSTVVEIMAHQLLSERRFFGEFLGLPEPPAVEVLPAVKTVAAFAEQLLKLAEPRLPALANHLEPWWMESVPFFDVQRQRAWIVMRRILHTAHHRTQLTVYLRLLGKPVPSVYGPTKDETWEGADPTTSLASAARPARPK